MKHIIQRGEVWYLRRGVPLKYASVEDKKIIWKSLRTDSKSEAMRKAAAIWEQLESAWEAELRGENSETRFQAAHKIAETRHFKYEHAAAVADMPIENILARLESVRLRQDGSPIQREGDALIGGVPEPTMTISKSLETFWEIAVDQVRHKTPDQVRRFENPKKKAITNFIKVIGDKDIAKITRADMGKFRDWWNQRIDKESLTANSAKKDISHVQHVIRTVNDNRGLNLTLPFGGLKIKDTPKGKRLPFSTGWIKTKFLADGAFDTLNDQARCIVLACIDTGCRPSEIAGLMKHHIHLDTPIPYIEILPEGRELKNKASERRIPLVGVSLKAFKAYMPTAPKGEKAFPTYFGKDKLSVTVNKYMRENGLLETDGHTLYGLRHSFEDRMTAAEPAWPERMKCDVFGHALSRQRYGEGATLEHIHRRMSEIAL